MGGSFNDALEVECWQTAHMRAFMLTAVPGALLYVVGFPTMLLILLLRLRNAGALKHGGENYNRRWVLRLGFLFAGYEDKYVFWEAIVLARKALLSAMAVFLAHSGTTIQVVVAVFILFLSYSLQMKYEPLEHDWHDLMEERSLLSSTVILIVCLLANANAKNDSAVGPNRKYSDLCLCFHCDNRLLLDIHSAHHDWNASEWREPICG